MTRESTEVAGHTPQSLNFKHASGRRAGKQEPELDSLPNAACSTTVMYRAEKYENSTVPKSQ